MNMTWKHELRSTNIMEIVNVGNIISLFAPPNPFEMFYLCKVVEVEVAKDDIFDGYKPYDKDRNEILKCNHLEKSKEIKEKVCYRKLRDFVLFYLAR